MHQSGSLPRPPLLLPLLLFAALCAATRVSQAQDGGSGAFYEYPGVSSAEILQARGFQADELFITTSSGNRLRITRGRNPLIRGTGSPGNREPVLFVHGVLADSSAFLLNSFNATPKDFTGINLATTNLSDLNNRLGDEPSARALPLLCLNFGREVWLVDRRGALGSREPTGGGDSGSSQQNATGPLSGFMGALTSLGSLAGYETKFWNYSLDEQARVDFPEIVDFVLVQTGRTKLALVTHSAGGAIALMSQSLFPERLARKISSAIYWAPAYSVGNANPAFSANLALMAPIQGAYIGPFPPILASMALQNSLALMCATSLAQETTCRALMTSFYGDGGGREPAKPEIISNQFFPSSSHELAQLSQQVDYTPRSMRMYNYGPEGNMRAYQASNPPPAYDLRRLRCPPNSMSFIVGSTDGQVTPTDVATTLQQVEIPHKFRVIDEIPFSHVGFFFNTEAPRQAIISSMRELETLAG